MLKRICQDVNRFQDQCRCYIMCSNALKTNYLSIIILISLIILNITSLCSADDSPFELYPFNKSNGDAETPRIDDGGSDKIKLKRTFKFFGKNYTSVYVNNNGILTFENKIDEYKPQSFPSKENRSIIAPFWADVNTEHVGGSVWFRETFEQDLLDRASAEIRSYFLQQRRFTATWMFIATWYNVGYYGASRDGKNKRNTFQAVLITNEIHSFVIFNYKKIQWTTGSNSGGNTVTGLGGHSAQAGFNAGDLVHYYSIEGAQTPAVINLTLTSNVDIPGKWVFQVDSDSVQDNKCKNAKNIVLSPSFGDMLGGNKINISGPCVSSDFIISAYIVETNTSVTCKAINQETATCVFPPIFRTGEMTLQYNPYEMGWDYSTLYIVNNIMRKSADIVRRHPDNWIIGASVTCAWNSSLIPSRSVQLNVLYYSEENGPGLLPIQSFHLSTNDTRNGEFKFILDRKLGNHRLLVLSLSWNDTSTNQMITPVIWSDIFPVRWKNPGLSVAWCNDWLKSESKKPNLSDISSSCPCTSRQALRDVGRYHADPLCNTDYSNSATNCEYREYHSSVSLCLRRNYNIHTSSGELCCYGTGGELLDIRDDPNGGTHDRYHYQAQGDNIVPYFSFYVHDLFPYLHCCQYSASSQMCQNFQKYRPPTTCQSYNPPVPAQAAGDPHLTTLDGLDYTFNGVGDFILLQDNNSSSVVQVRAIQTKDANGILQNASVFSAVAIAIGNMSDRIEIYKTDTGNARILVNGIEYNMNSPSSSELKDVTISRNKTSNGIDVILVVSEVINLSVSIETSSDLINILVMVGEQSLKGALRGLLGNFNDDPSDDFISRNGSILFSSSSLRVIHYDFGMSWEVQDEESLFSVTTQVPVSYEPVFNVNKSVQRNGTGTICKKNPQCIFDYQVTGDEQIAKSTLTFNEKFQELKEDIKKVVRCPHLTEPENGNKSITGYMVGSTATFWCFPQYQMLCNDCELRVCEESGTWSGSVAVCAEKIDTGKEQEILPVAAGSAGGAGIVLIAVVVFCLCYRRKRTPKPDDVEDPTEFDFLPPTDIPSPMITSVFENEAFIDSLRHLHVGGPYRIPRPNFVDPDLFDEFFF